MTTSKIFLVWLLAVVGVAIFVSSYIRDIPDSFTNSGLSEKTKLRVWVFCFVPAIVTGFSVEYVWTIPLALGLIGVTVFFDFLFAVFTVGLRPVLRPVAKVGIRIRDECRLAPNVQDDG